MEAIGDPIAAFFTPNSRRQEREPSGTTLIRYATSTKHSAGCLKVRSGGRRIYDSKHPPFYDFEDNACKLAINRQAAAMVLEVAYGFRALPENDPYIRLAEGNMAYVIVAGTGKYLVEIMPWLKYVPAWFPGASFQTVAKEARKVMSDAIEVPFEAVQKALVSSTVLLPTFF